MRAVLLREAAHGKGKERTRPSLYWGSEPWCFPVTFLAGTAHSR
jgi:hypothetical protein